MHFYIFFQILADPLDQDQAPVLYRDQDPAQFQDPNRGLSRDPDPVRDQDPNPVLSQGRDPAQDLDQNPARFLEPDPLEQDLDQNHALLLWPDPVQDPPGQNQDPGQDQNLGPSLDPAQNQFQDPGRGQNQDLVQNHRNWVSNMSKLEIYIKGTSMYYSVTSVVEFYRRASTVSRF